MFSVALGDGDALAFVGVCHRLMVDIERPELLLCVGSCASGVSLQCVSMALRCLVLVVSSLSLVASQVRIHRARHGASICCVTYLVASVFCVVGAGGGILQVGVFPSLRLCLGRDFGTVADVCVALWGRPVGHGLRGRNHVAGAPPPLRNAGTHSSP